MNHYRWYGIILILNLFIGLAAMAAPAGTVVLRGLDKVTAKTTILEVPTDGKPVSFDNLSIVARACHKAPPEELPEATAFLEVNEHQTTGKDELIFSGWMFASNPGLSGLEHPVYDLWVIDCKNDSSAAPSTAP